MPRKKLESTNPVGRPKATVKSLSKNFYIPEALLKVLENHARETKMTRSAAVTRIISEYFGT
jgi:hypothetical protein